MAELTPIIKDSFLQFSGAVLQSRALMDARDCIKPSARQIFYCLYTDKFIHSKPFQKTLKAIGSSFRMYIHGDASCEGVIMRAGQPFAMRYPLIEVEGSYGTLLSSDSWAAPRYTSARLSPLAEYLFDGIDKDTISEWRDNYDNTEKYPAVLPSKGYFNLVNGSYGIGVGMSGSLPQYNIRELNNALIKLLWNPNIDFDEIYCIPDFATGAILVNADEVKESHRNGRGASCKLRAVVEWDSKDRTLNVIEIPYMLYTETICKELESIINSDDNPGIERFNDLTGKKPNIKIYINKNANPDKILKYLYKNTSLQSYYSVNMTMLRNGRFPDVYTWKELLQAHIDHEIEVYTRQYNFELHKINNRLHIVKALLKAVDAIDEVVKTIKSSDGAKDASIKLQALLNIDEIQAKAILDIKLSRLAHLEVTKLKNEEENLLKEKTRIEAILNDDFLLKKEIEKGLQEVADKFGDARRTKVLNLSEEDGETIEIKTVQVSLTNKNNICTYESSTLYTQRRGGVGNKIKLAKGEYVISSLTTTTDQTILFFTEDGQYYIYKASELPIGEKIPVESLFCILDGQKFNAISAQDGSAQYIIFITKQGYLKKSLLSEYATNRSGGIKAITLNENDSIKSVSFVNEENIGILTKDGNFLTITQSDVRPIGRIAKGIKAIKLSENDEVAAAHPISENCIKIITCSSAGLCKQMDATEFSTQGKNTKGTKVQKLVKDDCMSDFLCIGDEKEMMVAASNSIIKIALNEIPDLSKTAQGTKTIKLGAKEKVIGLSKL